MSAHLAGNHSIAYYNLNSAFLGDANYHVPSGAHVLFCMSGPGGDERLRTWCCDASKDDQYCTGESDACIVGTGPSFVVDGCYGAAGGTTSSVGPASSTVISLFTPEGSFVTSVNPPVASSASSGDQTSPPSPDQSKSSTSSSSSSTNGAPTDSGSSGNTTAQGISTKTFAGSIVGAIGGTSLLWFLLFLCCTTRASRSAGIQRIKHILRRTSLFLNEEDRAPRLVPMMEPGGYDARTFTTGSRGATGLHDFRERNLGAEFVSPPGSSAAHTSPTLTSASPIDLRTAHS
ncbi:hypothetical protein SISSUDRAFT_1122948 [Sistotremastrum suecicum HHB10207 ss-3]|uniref:Uncharacterized protein n=1 Tax=Sistotremastrum suecicum HHB10207 ss-3 TaxID=1314776 RepID=A0A165YJ03_9AGAM|nr:hypothetical protein SISSUDRAFT_1122948 [Sistotremastrum suecicum HHB10207 ss-3]